MRIWRTRIVQILSLEAIFRSSLFNRASQREVEEENIKSQTTELSVQELGHHIFRVTSEERKKRTFRFMDCFHSSNTSIYHRYFTWSMSEGGRVLDSAENPMFPARTSAKARVQSAIAECKSYETAIIWRTNHPRFELAFTRLYSNT